jgi:hypothetical protein
LVIEQSPPIGWQDTSALARVMGHCPAAKQSIDLLYKFAIKWVLAGIPKSLILLDNVRTWELC